MKLFPTKSHYMTTHLTIEDIVYILVQKRLMVDTFDVGNFKALNNKIHFKSTFYGVDSNLITGRRVSNTTDIDMDGIIVDKGEYRMIKLTHSFGFDQKIIFFLITGLL